MFVYEIERFDYSEFEPATLDLPLVRFESNKLNKYRYGEVLFWSSLIILVMDVNLVC